ncbi:hypothetical protein DL95DRAFT_504546 [Leptodontidium sp. 2 PMI_412]|nr:hypothetical protein DL95DRAFT_504546 [Leptodontidium sp. 2 PMI_412]
MAPHPKKSSKSPSSSSKPVKKPASSVGSMLNSVFFKDSSEAPKSKPSKTSEVKDHPKKDSSSKYVSKSTKPSSSKPPKTTSTRKDPVLESAFFRDESRVVKPLPSERVKHSKPPSQPAKDPTPPPHPHPPTGWQPSETPTPVPSEPASFSKPPPPQPPQDWEPPKTVKPKQKSTHITDHDKEMAKKQLKIEKLSAREMKEQEVWAQEKLVKSGSCPQGWGWERYTAPAGYEKYNGYRCGGSPPELNLSHVHMITDELLAEGKCGYYQLSHETNWWTGPHYPSNSPGTVVQLQNGLQAINSGPGIQQMTTSQPSPNQVQMSINNSSGTAVPNSSQMMTPEQFSALFESIFSQFPPNK